MAGKNPKNGSPTAALLFGVSFYALASYWPQVMGGRPNAADDVYTGLFKLTGALAVLGGLGGYYNAWRQREKRKASEEVSGTFGEAAFATLEKCRDAGLLDPNGLYLGLLDGQPIFYSGKAHLLTCAPALGAAGYGLWPRMDSYRDAVERQRQLLGSNPALQDLVRMATLAANGHNTQPWRFRLAERNVTILPDLTRRTPVVDPDDHHLCVSLGCVAENLVIAAAAHGHAAEVAIEAGSAPRIDIALSPSPEERGALYQAIPLRQSTRSVYDGQPVSSEDLALLQAAAREEGVNLLMFTERADLDAILEFVIAGNSAQMEDPAFVQELQDWLRFSPGRAVETGDGLFGACSGNPVVPDWIGAPLFRSFFTKEGENDKWRCQTDSNRSRQGQ